MKRPGYREAIEWLAYNDDCYWLEGGEGETLSVSASMVRDLFDVPAQRFIDDLMCALKRAHPTHSALCRKSQD